MKTNFIFAALTAMMFWVSGVFATVYAEEAPSQKFVNVINENGRPACKTVYRASGAQLFNVKQFVYTYDAQNRVAQVDIHLWNEDTSRWELRYSTSYSYDEGFQQQMREFKIGSLQYEVIADQHRISEILAL